MVELLNLNLKHEWLPLIKQCLHRYKSILNVSPESVINQIIRGEEAVFLVNKNLVGIGHKYVSGEDVVFHNTFACDLDAAGFFSFRAKLRDGFPAVLDFVKYNLGCDRLDWICVSDAHEKFYRVEISRLMKNYKRDYRFRITL
jgi:hypothetical protein